MILGYCLLKLGRYAEAEPLLVNSYQLLQSKEPQRKRTQKALQRVVVLYEAWGKADRAAQYRALPSYR